MSRPPSDTPPLLDLRGVSKIYETGGAVVHALDGIDLSVQAGEYVAIIGSSGSGKSTLMHILGCLDQPSAGSYRVAGVDVATLDGDALAGLRRDTFGFVFQRYNLVTSASALENVELPAVYAGLPHAERRHRAAHLLDRLGLGARTGHRPGELSGGQQQRVSIARALMNDAAVVLADEPTGALDSASGAEVLDLLDALNREGRTILLITHDAAVAARARRVVRLHDGHIVEDRLVAASAVPVLDGGEAASSTTGPVLTRHAPALPTMLAEAAVMAVRSLRANLFRTALTLLGVVIGVAAVITMLAIGEGSSRQVVSRIQAMGADLLVIRPGGARIRASNEIATLTTDDAAAIAGIPGVVAVTPERSSRLTLRSADVDLSAPITGAWPGFPTVRDWTLAEGAFFTEADIKSYSPVVVLGQTVAKTLFPDWAEGRGPSPVGRYVMIRNVPFEVIGLLETKGASPMGTDQDEVAVVPLSTGFMRLFGRQYLHSITLKMDSARDPSAAVTALLTERHGKEDFFVRNTAAIIATASETLGTLTILLGSVALISLLVGGIGVMNIMLVSVTERTREIGVRMATGARMGDILIQFNTEALVVCGIGGLAGVGMGLGAAVVVGGAGLPVAFTPGPPVLAFACAFTTGLVFGYLPARKAARLDPVIALASE